MSRAGQSKKNTGSKRKERGKARRSPKKALQGCDSLLQGIIKIQRLCVQKGGKNWEVEEDPSGDFTLKSY